MLTPDQRRAAIEARFPTWVPRSLHAQVDHLARTFGGRPLVITDERTVTYAEVADWSHRLADGLASLGVMPGDRVGILMANFVEYFPLKVAISRAGAVAVPLNYLFRASELEYVLRQSRCNVLITMTGFGDTDYLALLDEVVPGWDAEGGPDSPDLRKVVLVPSDSRSRPGVPTLDDLAARGAGQAGLAAGRPVKADAVSDIFYTSGTTGKPKGVMLSHDAQLRSSYASALSRAFEDGRRLLFSLPLYHVFGYVEGVLACLWTGGSVVLLPRFSPAGYFRGVERHRATEILAVPTMTVAMLEDPHITDYDLSSLRAILSAAAPAPAWVWAQARKLLGAGEIVTGWGMTETGAGIAITRPEDALEIHSTTVGSAKYAGVAGIPDRLGAIAELRTIDPVSGAALAEGEEGEIIVRSPCVMTGFWEQPEATAAVLDGEWLRTGDLGRIRPDGRVQLTGRSKELYKSGGELVMPREIEELLGRQPGVSQAYVIGLPDERWGETGCAVIVREPGSEVTEEGLLAVCRENLARFKVPKRVVFLDSADLPVTATGKVQKFRLPQVLAALPRGARHGRSGPRPWKGGRVRLDIVDGVAELRLNRPEAGNAIDAAMVEAVAEAVTAIEADGGVRAVLISAAGPSFCVGGDLRYLLDRADRLPAEFEYMIGRWHETLPRLAALPVPVVAAAQGGAAGGGLGLLWCSDVVIAADSLKLVSGFTKLGFSGDGGSTWHLPRLVGLRRAQQFLLRSTPLDARQALDWGLVTRVVPAAELETEARREADELAQGPTYALGRIKRLLLDASRTSYSEHLIAERDAMVQGAGRRDVQAGMTAFFEGRRPAFDGQ